MKKLGLLIIGLFLFPVIANAAVSPDVESVTATADGTTINYSGTTVGGSTAVKCKLYNSNDEELDDFSTSVDEDAFSGNFTADSNGEYEVRCANYEGGIVKGATVTIDTIAEAQSNPPTGDSIYTYGIIAGIALIGIGIVVVILTKKKK
ncbi:MAG: hypothetical protein K5666_00790 [Bacilli bacterium]|nr:hypothetical protein [Bacilli bacterium]